MLPVQEFGSIQVNRPPIPPNPPHSLLCVYYPQQLLPGLAAVIQLRRHEGVSTTAPLLVIVWSDPGVSEAILAKRRVAFELLLARFPWVRLLFLPPTEVKAHLSANLRVRTKAGYLEDRFGKDGFAAIYYAHDIGSDFFAQSAMQAFPNATRVCFGDALGVVYSIAYYTEQTFPIGSLVENLKRPGRTLRNVLWRVKRHWTLPRVSRRLDADYAVLMLPCDPGGDFLPGKKLLVVDRDSLSVVLDGLTEAVADCLPQRVNNAVKGGEPFLMLLGSFSESQLTSEQSECAMYVAVARRYVEPGGVIVLKAHPASYSGKIERIAQALGERHRVTFADNDALPIEALRTLVEAHRVISFSYSSVSLVYLYGIKVIHAMTAELIDRYFPERSRQWMHESNLLYLEQLDIAERGCGALSESLHGNQ